jgi:hypothetical protein
MNRLELQREIDVELALLRLRVQKDDSKFKMYVGDYLMRHEEDDFLRNIRFLYNNLRQKHL